MPTLRSTRSRKNLIENTDSERENITSKKQQSEKEDANKYTRSGRILKGTKQPLSEINSNQKSSNIIKNKDKKKSKKEKMASDISNETTEEAAKKTNTDISEQNENRGESPTEPINELVNTAIAEKASASMEEAMDVSENTVENEDISPSKKRKISADQDSNIVTNQELNKNQDICQEEQITEQEVQQEELEDKQKLEEKSSKAVDTSTGSKGKSMSLKSQSNANKDSEDDTTAGSNLPKQLLTVISNLYLNVGERLRLDFPPRCLDDLAFCHRHHYRSDLPEAPNTSQAHSLRSALQHYRYVSFINATTYMCHRGEFPGKGIFTKIMELVLSINYSTKQPNVNIAIYQQSYHKSIELFSMIVRTFPPCWHKMRTYYVGFLEYGLDTSKLKSNKDETTKSAKIFDIILDLLEVALTTSKSEDLSTLKSESLLPHNTPVTSPLANSELSMCSEYWNQNEYEERERQKQTYDALPMDQKLERIFMALRLLLQILENDLAMWMLHHNRKTKEWIFSADNRPLIVVLCELTQYTRMTRVARRIFSVYSEAAAKGLCKRRLGILERFISLLMVASNTADMENTAIGVKYPYLGEQTKTLIHEFFKIFKAHNREEISKYMETIEILRIPYVRYEFIDNVLIMFQFTNSEPLTPQKIALDIAKKRWLKYKPASELTNPDEYISREQYLHLLLDALRCYSEFHGSKIFLYVITDTMKISPLTTTNDSVHRWPTHGSGLLVLKKMAKDIKLLESKLKMTVRMSKPKVDLPLADICIDEAIILKYRTDLKFIISLQNVLLKQKEAYPDVDFNEWLEFLNDFSPKKIAKCQEN